jgi:HD-GYP domain-containing protein (c-di-GMP phosphodiesterase class II)
LMQLPPVIFEHCVNVLSLTIMYCILNDFLSNTNRKLGVSALLYDIGSVEVDKTIIESKHKLSEEEFKQNKSHPIIGQKLLFESMHFDELIAKVALKHHEKLDGTGLVPLMLHLKSSLLA